MSAFTMKKLVLSLLAVSAIGLMSQQVSAENVACWATDADTWSLIPDAYVLPRH